MSKERMYDEITRSVNQIVGREAVTQEKLQKLIAQAKEIRRTQGTPALIEFAKDLPYRMLTPNEIDKLQRSSKWKRLSYMMLDLLIMERVVTPFEAVMLKRYI